MLMGTGAVARAPVPDERVIFWVPLVAQAAVRGPVARPS